MIIYDSNGKIKETQRVAKSLPYFYPQYGSNGLTQIFIAGQIFCAATANSNLTSNIIYAIPIIAPPRVTKVIGIQYQVQSAAAGKSGILGLYTNTGEATLYPSGLIWMSNPTNHTAGVKLSNTSIILEPGKLYWAVYNSNNNTQIRVIARGGTINLLGFDERLHPSPNMGYIYTYTFDENLPNPFPTGASILSHQANNMPAIGFRFGF